MPPNGQFVAQSQAAMERALSQLDEKTIAAVPADATTFAKYLRSSLSQAATQLADTDAMTSPDQLPIAIAILEKNLNFDAYPGMSKFSPLAKANGCQL